MSEPCEMSDLPPEMCSHCRGLDYRPPKLKAEAWTEAKYASMCTDCDLWILPGDRIAYIEDGYWVCSRCAE
jgi:hypothetical protein